MTNEDHVALSAEDFSGVDGSGAEPRDDFEGIILEDGIKVEKFQRRIQGSGFYKAVGPSMEPLLVKRFSSKFLSQAAVSKKHKDGGGFVHELFSCERSFINKHSDLPFVPRLIRTGSFGDEPYIVMEWAAGITVKEILSSDEIPPDSVDVFPTASSGSETDEADLEDDNEDEREAGDGAEVEQDDREDVKDDDDIKKGGHGDRVKDSSGQENKRPGKKDLKWAIDFALELSSAVRVLHRRSVFHKGLLPENLLIDETTGSLVFIDLVRSGACTVKKDESICLKDLGTLDLRASYIPCDLRSRPELVLDENVARRLDVFATGRITLELLLKVLEGEMFVGSAPMAFSRVKKAMAGYSEPLINAVLDLVEPFTDRSASMENDNRKSEKLTVAGLCHAMERIRSLPEFAVEGSAKPIPIRSDLEKKLAASQGATSKYQAVSLAKEKECSVSKTKVIAVFLVSMIVAAVFFFVRGIGDSDRAGQEEGNVRKVPRQAEVLGDRDENSQEPGGGTEDDLTEDVHPGDEREADSIVSPGVVSHGVGDSPEETVRKPGGEDRHSEVVPSGTPAVEERLGKIRGGLSREAGKMPLNKKTPEKRDVDLEDEFLRVIDNTVEKDSVRNR